MAVGGLGMMMSGFAVLHGRARVLLRLFVVAVLVMECRLAMVMRRVLVMGGRIVMMFA
jgi:hypothetical protein